MIIKRYLLLCFTSILSFSLLADNNKKPNTEEIAPTEDLMREHGLLNRILLIYEECIKRLSCHEYPRDQLIQATEIIQTFIEEYHEKLEEKYIFPLFEKKYPKSSLTATLRKQHVQGRKVTAKLQSILAKNKTASKATASQIKKLLQQFITMYRPHEAREDTIVFPAVREILDETSLEELSEIFEESEETLFGKDGFERIIKKVANIEKELGIFDLAQFTPKI